MNQDNIVWAGKVNRLLFKTRKTQMDLAIALGVSVTTISRWANGKHVPDPRSKKAIQTYLDMEGVKK